MRKIRSGIAKDDHFHPHSAERLTKKLLDVEYQIEQLDHLGIVAEVCREVGIAAWLDKQVEVKVPTNLHRLQKFVGMCQHADQFQLAGHGYLLGAVL